MLYFLPELFVFVHVPPIFSVLLTHWLKINSLLFEPPCISVKHVPEISVNFRLQKCYESWCYWCV